MAPPSTNPESVDWEALDGRSPRLGWPTRAFVVGIVLLAALFVYVRFFRVSDAPLLGLVDPTYHDWLFALGLLTFARYVVWPLATHPERTRMYWQQLRANPAGLAAFAVIVAFFLVGTLGPPAVGERSVSLYDQYQPPVFFASHASVTSPCVGEMVGDWCHGSWTHPLGTDQSGIDVVWLLVSGTRISLLVALVGLLVVAPLAIATGVLSAYYGGWVDALLMRYVDVQEALPAFVVYVFLAVTFGESLLLLLVAFGLLSWGGIARLVRSEALQRTQAGYVKAARNAGASARFVARRHLVPNVASTALTAATQLIPRLILVEAAASFLYLSHAGLPSWGVTLAQGLSNRYASFPPRRRIPGYSQPLLVEKWWVAGFTLVLLVLTVVAFSVFGDSLRDILDPRTTADVDRPGE